MGCLASKLTKLTPMSGVVTMVGQLLFLYLIDNKTYFIDEAFGRRGYAVACASAKGLAKVSPETVRWLKKLRAAEWRDSYQTPPRHGEAGFADAMPVGQFVKFLSCVLRTLFSPPEPVEGPRGAGVRVGLGCAEADFTPIATKDKDEHPPSRILCCFNGCV